MANITVTTAAVFIPEIWSLDVKAAVEASLVMSDKVLRFDNDVNGKGDTIHIPDLSNLTASVKAADADVTFQAPTEGETTISIDKHYDASFKVEDIAQIQSNQNLMGRYTGKAGYAIAQQMDETLMDLYAGLSQTTGSGASALADADILGAIELLDEADAPMDSRYFMIRPAAKADMLALDKFSLANESGSDRQLRKGELGEFYGVQIFMTTQTPLVTTVAHNILFQEEAFAMAVQQQPRVQSEYRVAALATEVVVDSIWGVKEYRDSFGVDVQSLN